MFPNNDFTLLICIYFMWSMQITAGIPVKKTIYDVCSGGPVTEPNGQIISPNYPSGYGNNRNCTLIIPGSPGRQVVITFHQFNLEACGDKVNDFVRFLSSSNGIDPDPPVLCGSYFMNKPLGMYYFREGAKVAVWFQSDHSVMRGGFKLQYKKIQVCGNKSAKFKQPEETFEICSKRSVIDKESGNIVSPNYPNAFANNLTCRMSISVPRGSIITFIFVYFKTNPCNKKSCEELRITTSLQGAQQFQFFGDHTGINGQLTFTSDAAVILIFRSDHAMPSPVSAPGFSIYYEIEKSTSGLSYDICTSATVTGDSGLITAPATVPSHDCEIEIDVPFGKELTLTFNELSVPTHDHGNNLLDVVWWEGGYIYYKFLGDQSTKVPFQLKFRGWAVVSIKLLHRFFENFDLGFSINYKLRDATPTTPVSTPTSSVKKRDICQYYPNGIGTSGYLNSPNYPNNYRNTSYSCSEDITVPNGKKLKLEMVGDLNLPSDYVCGQDYFQAYSTDWNMGIIMCGYFNGRNPVRLELGPGVVSVMLYSDGGGDAKGFSFYYEVVSDC